MEKKNQNYSALSLHQLRNVAREMGVKAPTQLKKQQILDEISLIISGKKPPFFSSRGRPVIKDKEVKKEKLAQIELKMQKIDKEIMRFRQTILDILYEK